MEAVDMDTREIKQLVDFFCQRVQDNKTTYILLEYRNNVLKYSLNNASTTHTTNNVQQHQIDGNLQHPPPPYTTATQQLITLEAVKMNIRVIKHLVDFFYQRVRDDKTSYISLDYRNRELKFIVQLYHLDGSPQQPPPPHTTPSHYIRRIGNTTITLD